jgi:opacity protein-like surface antigen
MKSICRICVITVLVIACACTKGNAQYVTSRYEAGISLGSLIYQGDLSESAFGYTRVLKPALGLYVARALDDQFSLRLNLNIGGLTGNDASYSTPAYRKQRAFSFNTSVTELSAMMVWHPLGNNISGNDSRFSPYVFAGIGASMLGVSRNWSHLNAAYFQGDSSFLKGLARDTTTSMPKVIPVIPAGVGVRYRVTDKLGITAEWTYRLTFTDYLDGFKYAANPGKNDYYYGFMIGISYRFGHDKMDCPKVPK